MSLVDTELNTAFDISIEATKDAATEVG